MNPSHMWLAFIYWALSKKEFRTAFQEEMGISEQPLARSAIDAMIDEATGIRLDYVKKFVIWVTQNHWGEEYAPEIYFKKFKNDGG